MAIPKEKHETIRTLYELGHSVRMIATVVGIPGSTLHDNITDIVDEYNPKGVKKLPTSDYVNASLIALSIQSDSEKSKITALNSVKVDSDSDSDIGVLIVDDTAIKQSILDELKAQ